MSTEPASEADIRACLAGHSLASGAEPHLVKILGQDLKGVSTPLLKDAVAARLASDEYAIFRAGPVLGSTEWVAAQAREARRQAGGINNTVGVTQGGLPIIDFAGAQGAGVAVDRRQAAAAELAELSALAGRPNVPYGALNSAEQLAAFAERYKSGKGTSGLVIIPPKR
jgi:hypothetical protein